MHRWTALVLGLSLALAGTVQAQSPGGGSWIGGAPLRGRIVVGDGSDAWVGVWVDAPNVVPPSRARAPMAVSMVIDTSGSMAGEKIRNAQLAASSLLESLSDGDIVSIYGFSNQVAEVAPPTLVNSATRGALMARVGSLVAGGGTNLFDGMSVGVSRISQAPPTHPVRRIFLISDGHANVGPSDPGTLADLASRATEWGTQITAIGVGYDYDPHTLSAMVVRSAGRLHHLGEPSQMASILETELMRLQRSVALNGRIEIVPAPGVIILSGATMGARLDGGRLLLPLGAVDAGQRRELLFRVRMPAASAGDQLLGTARLVFDAPEGGVARTQEAPLRVEVRSGALAASEQQETPRVAAMVAQHEASEAQRRAADALSRGDQRTATAELAQAQATVARAAASHHFEDAEVQGALRRRARELESEGAATGAAASPAAMRARAYELQAAPMAADGY